MNPMLLKAFLAMVPASVLFVTSGVVLRRETSTASLVQLIGAGCLVIVVLTHVCEAVGLLPWMHWGQQHSFGHYVDFSSTVLGLTLVPAGVFMRQRRKRRVAA
jgi:hypothetical protein